MDLMEITAVCIGNFNACQASLLFSQFKMRREFPSLLQLAEFSISAEVGWFGSMAGVECTCQEMTPAAIFCKSMESEEKGTEEEARRKEKEWIKGKPNMKKGKPTDRRNSSKIRGNLREKSSTTFESTLCCLGGELLFVSFWFQCQK